MVELESPSGDSGQVFWALLQADSALGFSGELQRDSVALVQLFLRVREPQPLLSPFVDAANNRSE